MHKEFIKQINKHKIISFDIFDTLLVRNVTNPTDLFDIVQLKYKELTGSFGIEDFKNQRIQAEDKARREIASLPNIEEVTLDQVYEVLKNSLNLNDDIIKQYKQLEIQAELDFCVTNPYMQKIYNYCLAQKKDIIIVSDMYLPQDTVEKLLSKNGFLNYKKLFLSSSIKLTKHTGNIFPLILNELKYKASDILHVGDNYTSDVQIPLKNGLSAYFYEKSLDLYTKEITNILKKQYFTHYKTPEDVSISVNIAQTINRFYCERNNKKDDKSNQLGYQIGYKYLGTTLCSLLEWIYRDAKNKNLKKIFFGSREGYIMHKAFQILFNDLPSEYFYISRKILHIPSITQDVSLNSKQAELVLEYLLSLHHNCVKDFLTNLGLKPDLYKDKLSSTGFNSLNDKINLPNDENKIKSLWKIIFEDLKTIAQEKRNILFDYYKNIGLLNVDKAGFVDIGWNGRLQVSLQKILGINEKSPKISGYYLGLLPKAANYKTEADMTGFYFDSENSFGDMNLLYCCIPLIEFLFTAPHGSVIGIKKTNDKFYPECDEDKEKNKVKMINEIHLGIMDFVNDYKNIKKSYKFLSINKEFAFSLFRKLIVQPSYKEATYLGNIKHVDGDIKKFIYVANPYHNPIKAFSKEYLFKEYSNCYWPYGFRVRVNQNKIYSKFCTIPLRPEEGLLNLDLYKKNFDEFCKTQSNKTICCYGAGIFANELLNHYNFSQLNIINFIDRDPNKKGTKINKYTIQHIEDLKEIKPDIILLTVAYNNKISESVHSFVEENNLKIKIFDKVFW